MELSKKAKEKIDLLSREVSRKSHAVFMLQMKRKPDEPDQLLVFQTEYATAYQAWKEADEAFVQFAQECNEGKHNVQAA